MSFLAITPAPTFKFVDRRTIHLAILPSICENMASKQTPAFQLPTFGTRLCPSANRLDAKVTNLRGRSAAAAVPARVRPTMRVYDVEVDIEGKTHNIPIDESFTLLEGIEEYGIEVLYSCRAGVCTTCAAKVLAGDIDLGSASMTDELKDDGYVLTCVAYPRSEGIKLEMNHFDDAYEKQYGRYEMNSK